MLSWLGSHTPTAAPAQVAVVRQRDTGQIFAMKMLHKWEMLKRAEVKMHWAAGAGAGAAAGAAEGEASRAPGSRAGLLTGSLHKRTCGLHPFSL